MLQLNMNEKTVGKNFLPIIKAALKSITDSV